MLFRLPTMWLTILYLFQICIRKEPKVVVPALLLAHASYLVMNQCFQLLGIRTVDRM
eukprot:m.183212 g.183212  ORF g.183212 m.183212 type:complete len:57 (+) comp18076_c0_seq3:2688-2858(+)